MQPSTLTDAATGHDRVGGKAEAGVSTKFEETLERAGSLALPVLGDWCLIHVFAQLGHPSAVRVVGTNHLDPNATERVKALVRDFQDSDVRRLLGGTASARAIALDLEASAVDPAASDLAGLARETGARSLLGVPLLVRERLLGTALLFSTGQRYPYTDADIRLAGQLAEAAALAIDNALLYLTALEATRARDEVLGSVAHDLRSPLSGIALHLAMVREKLLAVGAFQWVEHWATRIESLVRQMDCLIEDLLDVTRVEAGHLALVPARLHPRRLVDTVIDAFANRVPGVRLRSEVADSLDEVWGDEARLGRVLSNLVANALKFTPAGREVVVGATPCESMVRFRVSDNGPGIPPDQLSHLFERFWQANIRDRRGAGLGLSIAKALVELHAGRIWAESTLGRGTTVFFTVPRSHSK